MQQSCLDSSDSYRRVKCAEEGGGVGMRLAYPMSAPEACAVAEGCIWEFGACRAGRTIAIKMTYNATNGDPVDYHPPNRNCDGFATGTSMGRRSHRY